VRSLLCSLTLLVWGATAAPAIAQPPPAQAPAPPKVWTVAVSAGLALASGNTDTSTINAAYDIVYDPKTKNVVKSDALYLRGETEEVLSANRLGFNVRDEYSLTTRLFVFGQNQYLKDEFKNIDYLVAPTGGLGYKIFNTAATKLAVDGSAGVVWEKNPGFDVNTSGALAFGEKLTQTLTATTTLTQAFAGLWKTSDFADALFTAGIGVAVAISTHTQLKVEILDTYKNRPPLPTIQKNDVAVLMAFVYKS
jgi:putative salt-induced outer membrane protein YdiY